MKEDFHEEHIRKIKLGEQAKKFLESNEWKVLLEPIIDSMLKGLTDIKDIRKTILKDGVNAEAEIFGRALAAEYIEKIEGFLRAYIDDAAGSQAHLDKLAKGSNLYKDL